MDATLVDASKSLGKAAVTGIFYVTDNVARYGYEKSDAAAQLVEEQNCVRLESGQHTF
jgi:hypothetical protein